MGVVRTPPSTLFPRPTPFPSERPRIQTALDPNTELGRAFAAKRRTNTGFLDSCALNCLAAPCGAIEGQKGFRASDQARHLNKTAPAFADEPLKALNPDLGTLTNLHPKTVNPETPQNPSQFSPKGHWRRRCHPLLSPRRAAGLEFNGFCF